MCPPQRGTVTPVGDTLGIGPVIVRGKLVPPDVPDGLLVRPRLVDAIGEPGRFTLVTALPGFGKTVVVRHWAEQATRPVAWLTLDLLDKDPATFWTHLLGALGAVLDGFADEQTELLRERGPDDPVFVAALISRLETVEQPVVVVIDGLNDHLSSSTLDVIALVVERAGDRLRLIVTSRSDPHLPLGRWRANGWLSEVREDDLRVTADESVAIADGFGSHFGADDVRALNDRVEGWPIALHMALLADTDGAPPTGERLLADRLVGGVLESFDEHERHVALSLSVLRWFDPDLADDLVGPDAADVVRDFLERRLFLSVVDPRTGTMRFHALFRELLESELGFRDPARRIELHRHAAALWRERGDLTSAYLHLHAIGETARARAQLVDPAIELVDRGELDALRRFARTLPLRAEVDDAGLAADLALVAFYADGPRAAESWTRRARQLAGRQTAIDAASTEADLAIRLRDLEAAVALTDADLDAALEWIAERPSVTDVDSAFERRFPILAARALVAARRPDEAVTWIRRAERLETPEVVVSVTVPTLRAWHDWITGDLRGAIETADTAMAWIDEHDADANHLCFDTLVTAGWCHLSVGDLDQAARFSRRASVAAAELGGVWNALQAGFLEARLEMVTGDPQRALAVVDNLRSSTDFEQCRPYADRILGVEAEALGHMGFLDEARRVIDTLQPGPRAMLLAAQFGSGPSADPQRLLADLSGFAAPDALQARLVLATHGNATVPSDELAELVVECASAGWVLPLLGAGRRAERLLRSLPLAELHPRLAVALDTLAPGRSAELSNGVRLTQREQSLLELLPTHLTYSEMGEQLYLSVNTVKTNLKTLYRKLDVNTRRQAVDAGTRAGLL